LPLRVLHLWIDKYVIHLGVLGSTPPLSSH
jgi:hypothetical protein